MGSGQGLVGVVAVGGVLGLGAWGLLGLEVKKAVILACFLVLSMTGLSCVVPLRCSPLPVPLAPAAAALENPNKRASRLVVYIKSNVNYECLANLESDEDATIWLLIRRQKMRPLRIGCIYRE